MRLAVQLFVLCLATAALAQTPPAASFGQPIALPPWPYGGAGNGGLAIADVNNDGRADIVLDDSGGGSVFPVLQNPPNSDGSLSFSLASQLFTENSGTEVGVVTGDFNGDGKVDFLLACETGGPDINVFLGHGDGTFPSFDNPNDLPEQYGTFGCSQTLAVGDFNGDGKLDIVSTPTTSYSAGTLILLGNGNGTFQSMFQSQSSLQASPVSLAVGDFNIDGKLDIAVAQIGTCLHYNGCLPRDVPGRLSILLGKGDGTFQPAVDYDVGTSFWGIAAGDLNGDGKLDLVATNYDATSPYGGGNSISEFLGNGDGTFPQAPVIYSVPAIRNYTGASTIAIADFNGDGKADVAVGTNPYPYGYGAAAVLIGNGDVNGTLQPVTYYAPGLTDTLDLAVGDINGDGRPDIVIENTGGGYDDLLLNTSTYMNTATGTNVAVQPFNNTTATSPMTVTYSNVSTSGLTTLTSNPTAAPAPTNFQVAGSSTYYDLSTTAVVTGATTVCVSYNPASFTNTADIRLLHYQNGTWFDVTTSVDTTNSKVCGSVISFSPFVVAQATYNAPVQQPINSDGSSVFSATKGVIPVKFSLTQNNVSTCTLPTASIVLTRLSGSSPGTMDESIYTMSSDTGIYYRVSSCQYVYNVSAKSLGAGSYRVDAVIGNAVVGSGYFGLK